MSAKILLVEDSPHKRGRIIEYLTSLKVDIQLSEAMSFTSGCRALEDEGPFDLILLDLSLPTFDKTDNEPAGRFRPFGGAEIARKLVRRNSHSKILFITQYESFQDSGRSYSFDDIHSKLMNECGNSFAGMLRYSSKTSWKDALNKVVRKAINEDTDS